MANAPRGPVTRRARSAATRPHDVVRLLVASCGPPRLFFFSLFLFLPSCSSSFACGRRRVGNGLSRYSVETCREENQVFARFPVALVRFESARSIGCTSIFDRTSMMCWNIQQDAGKTFLPKIATLHPPQQVDI